MRGKLKILFYASLAVLFSSCENLFKEECEAKGFLSATVSDKGPAPSTTEEIQVRYYDYHTGVEHTEKLGEPDYFALGNRFLSQLDAGTYRFLAYTRFNNKIRNAGDISTIEIYADTVVSTKYACPVIANPQHLVFMGKESGTVLPEDTTYRKFVLSPMVQKIIFNVTVRGLAPAQAVSGMEALLNGVITSRKIYTNQPQPSYAGLVFDFTDKEGKYTSAAYVFGLPNKVENTLCMEVVTNSQKYYPEVDLSSVLADFTADGIVFEIVIDLNAGVDPVVTIAGWHDLDWGEIQPVL